VAAVRLPGDTRDHTADYPLPPYRCADRDDHGRVVVGRVLIKASFGNVRLRTMSTGNGNREEHEEKDMAEVLLFHHAYGLTSGVRDFAEAKLLTRRVLTFLDGVK